QQDRHLRRYVLYGYVLYERAQLNSPGAVVAKHFAGQAQPAHFPHALTLAHAQTAAPQTTTATAVRHDSPALACASSSCASNRSFTQHLQVRLPAPRIHREDVDFAPAVSLRERVHLSQKPRRPRG